MRRIQLALVAAFGLSLAGSAAAQQAAPARAGAPSASLAVPKDAPPEKATPRGPLAVTIEANPGLMSHTIYRPTNLGTKKLPIIAWGNGACSNAGLLFENFLTQVASHGYMVIASGPKDAYLPAFASARPGQSSGRQAPPGTPPAPMTKDEDMQTAINWAIKQNADKASPYFGKLDPNKVAVMGQSCGGLQAIANSGDPRVKTSIIWNSGAFGDGGRAAPAAPGGTRSMSGATKESLKKLHAPIAYFSGGPADVAQANSADDFSRIEGVPAFWGWINVGHGGTFNHTGAGWFGEVGVAWLDWRLKGDAKAAKYFEGADCTLCKDPVWHVAKKGMK